MMKAKIFVPWFSLSCALYGVMYAGVDPRHAHKNEAAFDKAPRPQITNALPACCADTDLLAQLTCCVCALQQEICELGTLIDEAIMSCCESLSSQIASCCSIIDIIECAVGDIIPMTQESLTGGLTIDAPGYYKLCEDVTFPLEDGVAIVVTDPAHVTIDLGGFTLSGVVIEVESGASSVLIKNGTMTNNYYFIFIFEDTTDITVENMSFDGMVYDGVTPNAIIFAPQGPITGITVRNITGYDGSPTNIFIGGFGANIMDNVVLDNIRLVGFNLDIPAVSSDGAFLLQFCNNLSIRNISIENNTPGTHGISITNSHWVELQDINIASSQTLTNTPYGLDLQTSDTVRCDRMNITGTAFSNGINIASTNDNDLIFNNCVISFTSSDGVVANQTCIINNSTASNTGGNGFTIDGGDSIIQGCSAEFNTSNGFDLTNLGIECTQCNAFGNTGTGFNVSSTSDIHFIECTANANATDGFAFSGSFDNTCIRCTAHQNTNDGFVIMGSTISTSMVGCTANNNVNNGFEVGSGATKIGISESTANNNVNYGILIDGVAASYSNLLCAPLDTTSIGTWQIIDPGVRVSNCTAFYNGEGQIIMTGEVINRSNTSCAPVIYFMGIFPPIGIINTTEGAIFFNPFPVNSTYITVNASFGTYLYGSINGNIISTPNVSDTPPFTSPPFVVAP